MPRHRRRTARNKVTSGKKAGTDPSDRNRFDGTVLSLMQSVATFLGHHGYLKDRIHFKDLRFRKYQATHLDPFRPLDQISGIDDISTDELLYIYVNLESEKRDEEYFGNFHVDRNGKLRPVGYDDQKIDIYPQDVETDGKTIKKKVETALKEHRDRIWDAVVLIVNMVFEYLKSKQ